MKFKTEEEAIQIANDTEYGKEPKPGLCSYFVKSSRLRSLAGIHTKSSCFLPAINAVSLRSCR
jgi:hypothetical protein